MLQELSTAVVKLIKRAARGLSFVKRRAFQAEVAEQFCDSSPRKAESIFGWGRESVKAGIQGRQTGVSTPARSSSGGRQKSEDRLKDLVKDIQILAEPTGDAGEPLEWNIIGLDDQSSQLGGNDDLEGNSPTGECSG